MVYTYANVTPKCAVVDIEGGPLSLVDVESVDVERAQVHVLDRPITLNQHGEVVSHVVQFRSIHPIFGGRPLPVAFHCYR